MTAGRISGTCGYVVVVSMLSCGSAQAQSNVATAGSGTQIAVNAVAIGVNGAVNQRGVPGAPVTWTAAAPGQMDFDILGGPLELGRGAVKGAAYSAEAVNEVVQTLADGNRIVRSSTTAIYRDAEGRTRREQGLAIIGPLVATAEQSKHVVITDPDKGVIYVLDPAARTARRLPLPSFGALALRSGPGASALPVPLPALPVPPPPGDVVFFEAPFEAAVPAPAGAAVDVRRMVTAQRFGGQAEASEALGTQTIEGVLAEGTRSTVTIAAGQIGNERPIEIVSERWFSSELKVLVLSKQSDPRFGETTYRLSNIVLGDPEASLFEVPSDFQIVEPGGPGDVIFRRRVQP